MQFGGVYGLEQIIDAVHLEGPDGILVVGGGENNRAGHRGTLKQLKAQPIGQMNIQKQHVGRRLQGIEQHHGRGHRFGGGYYIHGRLLAPQQIGQAPGREGFIFDDKGAERSSCWHRVKRACI